MRVFLTGGTGFVGSYVLRALVAEGHQVRSLARLREPQAEDDAVEWIRGDVRDPAPLRGQFDGIDAVIHLVGILEEKRSKGLTFEAIHFEGTRNVVDAAREAGVTRFVFMSANGVRRDGVSAYQTTKWRAEEYVRAAGFDHWVIFRPTIIFGDPGEENPEFSKLLAQTLVKPFPILPVPGNGKYELQPISVEAVASAFVQALELPTAHRQSYCVAGKERLTFNEILDRIGMAIGQGSKGKIHHPLWMVRPAVKAGSLTGKLPITIDQLEMLVEGNTCDPTRFLQDFNVTPRPYTPENLAYLKQYV